MRSKSCGLSTPHGILGGSSPAPRRATLYIRPNIRASQPRSLIFFDTESWIRRREDGTEEHTFRLGVACHVDLRRPCESWRRFTDPYKLYEFIVTNTRPKITTWVFAHNVYYDLKTTGLLDYFGKNGWELQMLYVPQNRPTFIARLRKGQRRVVIVDVLNYYPNTTVAELGEYVGTQKVEVDFETATERELWQRCLMDVAIIKTAILRLMRFWKEHDLGEWAYTLSGLSFNAFRHRFYFTPLYPTREKEARKLERDSYYGGRTECWRLGQVEGPIYYIDVVSMYPAVMRDLRVPTKLRAYFQGGTCEMLENALTRGYCVIADVLISTDEPAYPKRHQGRVIYPIGRFWTTLATPELWDAYQRGRILAVGRMAVYDSAVVFREFIEFFYSLRDRAKKEGDRITDIQTKLIMNALYGKFGERRRRTEIHHHPEEYEWDKSTHISGGQKWDRWALGHFTVYQTTTDEETNHTFTAIASHVTSAGRIVLLGAMRLARPHNIVYLDTDALYVTREGYERIRSANMIQNKLGFYQLKGEYRSMYIYGDKCYLKDGQPTIAGVPPYALRIGQNRYRFLRALRLRSDLRRGKPGVVMFEPITFELTLDYHKRTVHPDHTTEPIYLEE